MFGNQELHCEGVLGQFLISCPAQKNPTPFIVNLAIWVAQNIIKTNNITYKIVIVLLLV